MTCKKVFHRPVTLDLAERLVRMQCVCEVRGVIVAALRRQLPQQVVAHRSLRGRREAAQDFVKLWKNGSHASEPLLNVVNQRSPAAGRT